MKLYYYGILKYCVSDIIEYLCTLFIGLFIFARKIQLTNPEN